MKSTFLILTIALATTAVGSLASAETIFNRNQQIADAASCPNGYWAWYSTQSRRYICVPNGWTPGDS